MALNTSTKRSSVVPGRRLSSPQNVLNFNLISQKIEYWVKTKKAKYTSNTSLQVNDKMLIT